MVRILTLLGLLLWTAHQAPPGSSNVVVPTVITTEPAEFAKGQAITIRARFQQRKIVCPAGKNPRKVFALKIYDGTEVATEPVWTSDIAATTRYRAYIASDVRPNDADVGKTLEHSFPLVDIQADQTERIYVVLWHACTVVPPGGHSNLTGDRVIAERYGGRFYRYSCPGTGKIPTGRCVYRAE